MLRIARALTAAFTLAALPVDPLRGQVYDPNPSDKILPCILDVNLFTSVTPIACAGFFDKNSMKFGTGATLTATGNTSDAWKALGLLGFDMSQTYQVLEKKDSWNGLDDFNTTMYGLTVVGIHWGNYGSPNDAIGNVSAFYLFDAGSEGINSLDLKSLSGVSNAAILFTGTKAVISEPASLMLVGAGLAAFSVAAARRRRR